MDESAELPLEPETPAGGRARTIATTLQAMVRTRLELLRGDLRDEQDSLVAQFRLGIFAAGAGLLASFTAVLALAAFLPPEYRAPVLGGLALALGAWSWWALRLRAQHKPDFAKPFQRLLEQLSQDVEACLGGPEERHRESH